MLRRQDPFSADYLVESAELLGADMELTDGSGQAPRRAVRFVPLGSGCAWTAAVRVARPWSRAAHSGDHATPRDDAALVVEAGVPFLVHVGDPGRYEVLSSATPVVEVEPVTSSGLLLLLSPWSITAIGSEGARWTTRRLSIEGLRADEVRDGWLLGVSDPADEEPREFAVELATGRAMGGFDETGTH